MSCFWGLIKRAYEAQRVVSLIAEYEMEKCTEMQIMTQALKQCSFLLLQNVGWNGLWGNEI